MLHLQKLALGLAGASLLTSAFASEPETESAPVDSAVEALTKDTFPAFIKEHDLVLAEFYAPWCGHCKALAPEYEIAAKDLKEKDIHLVKVDCTEETDLCQEQGVQGYPTLKVFRGLENSKPYTGPRKADGITSFMIKQSLPAVSTVTAENLEEFKTLDKVVVVAYITSDDKASNQTFTEIAEELRDEYLFGGTNDAALAKAEGVSQPAVVLYKDFDEKKNTFSEKFEVDSLKSFIKTSSTPLVGVVGPDTYAGYMAAGIPLAYIFAETQEERDQYAADLKPLAQKLKGKVNIATIDAKAYGAHAGNLNLDPEKFPAFALHDTTANKKYPYDQSKPIEAADITKFVEDVLAGKIEPSIKSEPIPESQDGPVTVVVAHNYEEIVLNNEKDVLIEFYAPWCGHCKALAPKYDELGLLYKNNPDFAAKVTIAKVDATANDVPDEIQGFPTIKLYPAGGKDAPIDYSGSRTVEDLANFVRDNGKHGVDAWVPPAEEEKTPESTEEQVPEPEEVPEAEPEAAKETPTDRHEEL